MSTHPKKILYLEDDEMIVRLVELTLKRHGMEITVEHVVTRGAFLEALATDHYELVLSDEHIPGFSGLAALKFVRTHLPSIPFIFFTGSVNETAALAAFEAGAQEYLSKDHLWRLPMIVAKTLSLNSARDPMRTQKLSGSQKYSSQPPKPSGL